MLFVCRSLPRQGLVLLSWNKRTKNSRQQAGFFALLAFALQNRQNLGWNLFTPCFAAPGLRFSKNFLCPAAARAAIVLPVFGWSFPAVGVKGFELNVITRNGAISILYKVAIRSSFLAEYKRQCHAELVSASHTLSIRHVVDLSWEIPKQVRDDRVGIRILLVFFYCHCERSAAIS